MSQAGEPSLVDLLVTRQICRKWAQAGEPTRTLSLLLRWSHSSPCSREQRLERAKEKEPKPAI